MSWIRRSPRGDGAPPLLVYHHIPKTGGTALRRAMQRNYPRRAFVTLYEPGRASVEWYRMYVARLGEHRLRQIRCVAGHTAHFIIPVLVEKAIPFRVCSLLRDPVERVLSLYYYLKPGPARARDGRGGEVGREIAARGWSLADVYRSLGGGCERDSALHELFSRFFDGQLRMLLAPHEPPARLPFAQGLTPAGTAALARAGHLLDEHYVVGVQERFAESIALFADRFGWTATAFRDENVTAARPAPDEIDPEIRTLIRSYNRLDSELHRTCLGRITRADDARATKPPTPDVSAP